LTGAKHDWSLFVIIAKKIEMRKSVVAFAVTIILAGYSQGLFSQAPDTTQGWDKSGVFPYMSQQPYQMGHRDKTPCP
jgi:hypothetical protein